MKNIPFIFAIIWTFMFQGQIFTQNDYPTWYYYVGPEIGQEISSGSNRYLLIDLLGEGVFGRVFSATDERGTPFAIKWYKGVTSEYDPFWNSLGDVQREFENGQKLNHPSIINSIDVFSVEEGDSYLVLEFVVGKTLHKAKRKSLLFKEALNYSLQIAEALKYAELQGFLHLDLHGNNIMINEAQQIKIIDLASFFTWEEVTSLDLYYFTSDATTPVIQQKKLESFVPHRLQKLKAFFSKNPELLQAVQVRKKSKSFDETEDAIRYKNLVSSVYFNRIVEICSGLIKKSYHEKAQKVELVLKIKRLALNYTEEANDGVLELKFEEYMEKLQEALASHQ